MPRAKLAHWYEGYAPGEVIAVDSDQLRDLQRDGRVAEVLEDDQDVREGPAAPASPEEPESPAPEDTLADPPVKESASRRRPR